MAKPGRKKKVITEAQILEYTNLKNDNRDIRDGTTYAPCDVCEHYDTCQIECPYFIRYVATHDKTGRQINYNNFKKEFNISDEEEAIRKEKVYRAMFE